ncbi:MAG: DUF4355 domain-containing protein [Clostridiales bacterium]|nr:DUF4355 domain-containing protein [Clostridiales bacterium]
MKFNELMKKIDEARKDEDTNLPDWLVDEDIEIGLETVKELAENDGDVSTWLQSEKDRAVTKGIETYKENTLPGIVEEKVEEKYQEEHPEETEEQKRIRELENKFEKQKKETKRESLKNLASSMLNKKELGNLTDVVPYLIGEDEATTKERVDTFAEKITEYTENRVESTTEKLAKKFGKEPGDFKETSSGDEGEEAGLKYPSMEK